MDWNAGREFWEMGETLSRMMRDRKFVTYVQYRKAGEMAFVNCLCACKDERRYFLKDKVIGGEAREFWFFPSGVPKLVHIALLRGSCQVFSNSWIKERLVWYSFLPSI